MRTAKSKQRKFPTTAALAVIILASMLIAFAALQHRQSLSASAQGASSNADLASLSMLLNERLTPRFDPDTTAYTVRVTRTNVVAGRIYMNASAKEQGATITVTSGGREIRGRGNYRVPVFDFGVANEVQVKVTAADGVTTKIYTLTTEALPPTATPTHTPTSTPTHTPTPTTSPTPEPPPPTDLDMKVLEDVAHVTFTPSQWTGSLQHFYLLRISRAATQKDEFRNYNSYIVQTSPVSLTDLTAGWWYRAQMRRCKTQSAVNCGHWSSPVYVHFPTIVKTQCGPALALGASQAVDLTPDDPLRYEKYPKLNAAWNEIFIKYEAAIGEGISPENAIARAWQGWAAREEYIISEPDSKFPQHRILGWIRFVHSSNFNQKTPTQWLRDFLAAQGISADVRDVFGEFHYDPEDVSGINNIMLPFTLAGPLSELPEVKSLHLVHNAPVFLE